ncbi:uncharacterized protein LOC143519282 isoform X1 [Brachyhypopomus gauderio]|uniref:uncharacterized protein LOC143519282 isoform X1 n=1 Tax=Brachyhypopomus gauderio TaxID=698409 RepID=UPI0040438B82
MSLTVTRAEGVTMFTVVSNPKSKWPLFCQILGCMCYSPVCAVSPRAKQHLGAAHSVLGTIQMMVGVANLGYGVLRATSFDVFSVLQGHAPFCLGGMFIAAGIMCILAERFPSPFLIGVNVVINIVSAAVAITAIVLYSLDLVPISYTYWCDIPAKSFHYTTAISLSETTKGNQKICQNYKHLIKMVQSGLDITMIVLGVLQFCVTISSFVLSVTTLHKTAKEEKMIEEDPQLCKTLLEDALSGPTC